MSARARHDRLAVIPIAMVRSWCVTNQNVGRRFSSDYMPMNLVALIGGGTACSMMEDCVTHKGPRFSHREMERERDKEGEEEKKEGAPTTEVSWRHVFGSPEMDKVCGIWRRSEERRGRCREVDVSRVRYSMLLVQPYRDLDAWRRAMN
ncbi:hypothetical protein LZ31DRAFT_556911 [Colletotrichum somersetense]|nr:hypothetical protein LZ31DRAFT_556911 [Colletotrichum somersetense]